MKILCLLVVIWLSFACTSYRTLPKAAVIFEDSTQSGHRQVFIKLPEDRFTFDMIESILNFYRPQCVPNELSIIIFSDPSLLEMRIARSTVPDVIDFTPDEKGRLAAERHRQEIYFPKGTYVANYHRVLYNESFEYRFSKENIPTKVTKYQWEKNPYKCALDGNRQ